MIAIVCLDKKNGMYFNERRQSSDRYVVRDILNTVKERKLYITPYSEDLFEGCKYYLSDDYFSEALEDDYCFIENVVLNEYKTKKIIVYRWDKVYPSDYRLNLSEWKIMDSFEFEGYSHEIIVKEVYEKNE